MYGLAVIDMPVTMVTVVVEGGMSVEATSLHLYDYILHSLPGMISHTPQGNTNNQAPDLNLTSPASQYHSLKGVFPRSLREILVSPIRSCSERETSEAACPHAPARDRLYRNFPLVIACLCMLNLMKFASLGMN